MLDLPFLLRTVRVQLRQPLFLRVQLFGQCVLFGCELFGSTLGQTPRLLDSVDTLHDAIKPVARDNDQTRSDGPGDRLRSRWGRRRNWARRDAGQYLVGQER